MKTTLGWYYLACVMDLYNREVIGYSTSKNIYTELVKRAIGNAIAKYLNVAIFQEPVRWCWIQEYPE
ncbi:MAG TPA: hypothetical protein PK113_02895 [Bacillota bacterium]|nr:hypothetical protein [Bacillota bacterium]